ncbi:MAG: hypothetical protein HY541_01280 [Deltaproteobacteria bacterium]|nr:hypothetical protein [Deltaproteobacteria bacterium]
MRSLSFILLFLFLLGACSGAGSVSSDENVSSGSTASTDISSLTYNPSGFSTHLEFTPEKNYLRIGFAFFPDSTAFDFEEKTVSIPCTFLNRIPEGVDVQLSAPTEELCDTYYTITFDGTGESFTLNGIVVPFSTVYEKFAGDFEFEITADGVRDVQDATTLAPTSGTLEDFYDLILERRSP